MNYEEDIMGKPFGTCPVCGCALDPCERCDCTDHAPARDRETTEAARITPPERAYCAPAIGGADLASGRDFTARARELENGG